MSRRTDENDLARIGYQARAGKTIVHAEVRHHALVDTVRLNRNSGVQKGPKMEKTHGKPLTHFSAVSWGQCVGLLVVAVMFWFAPERVLGQAAMPGSDATPAEGISFEPTVTGLEIRLGEQRVASYHREDAKILRPFFSSLRTPRGSQVTRNHPPIEGADATDHDTMHPGVWMAFGDISGQDFWRNKATMKFERTVLAPEIQEGALTFADSFVLLNTNGEVMGRQESKCEFIPLSGAWRLRWTATYFPQTSELVFGDQEEMGLGVRVATTMTEKNGGRILSSTGTTGAKATWGKSAAWCSYSGLVDGKPAGIVIVPSPNNFRASWWHNRDYGLMVANPFGQATLTGGAPGKHVVKKEAPLVLSFDVIVHDGEFSTSLVSLD